MEDDFSFTIRGKEVRLKESIPLKDGNRLPAMMKACEDGDVRTIVKVLVKVIESWDFPGDAHDPKTYEDMDIFVILPMGKEAALRLMRRLDEGTELKN